MVTRINNNNSKVRTPRAGKWNSRYWKVEPNITISEDTGNVTFMCDKCNMHFVQIQGCQLFLKVKLHLQTTKKF